MLRREDENETAEEVSVPASCRRKGLAEASPAPENCWESAENSNPETSGLFD